MTTLRDILRDLIEEYKDEMLKLEEDLSTYDSEEELIEGIIDDFFNDN